jgi:glycerophosphoryl diester phosphodiesterase
VPIVYAHRGGAALRPENTIAAFDHGMACGADGLEFDVHLSKDGVVVIHHDVTLERTTSGSGPLAGFTADELAALDACCHFRDATGAHPYRGQGYGVPTLREVLHRYPGAPLIVELKTGGARLAHAVVAEIRAADALDRVAIGSFHTDALHTVRACEPAIATGAAKGETRWALYRSWVGWPLGETPYREFQVPERSGVTSIVTRRFVRHAHRARIPVKVWTVDTAEDIRRLLSYGVDAVITDRPDVARSVIGYHEKPMTDRGHVPSAP